MQTDQDVIQIRMSWSVSVTATGLMTGIRGKVNGNVITYFSRTQKSVSTSSAEAEFTASCGTLQEGIAVQRMWDTLQGHLQDDDETPVEEYHSLQRSVLILRTDSSAAKAMMCKVGIGKTKHIAISLLWVQQWAQQRQVRIRSVSAWVNPADLFTKQLAIRRVALLLAYQGEQHFRCGQEELY